MHKAYIYTRTHTHIRYLHLDVSRRLDRLSVEQRAVRAVQVHDVRPAPPVISDSIDVGRSDKSQMPGHQNGLHIGNRFLVGPTQESTGSSTPVHQRGVINAASSTPVHQRGVINAGSSSAIVSGSVQKCRSIKTVYSHPQRTSPVGPGPRKYRFISAGSSARRHQCRFVVGNRRWSVYQVPIHENGLVTSRQTTLETSTARHKKFHISTKSPDSIKLRDSTMPP